MRIKDKKPPKPPDLRVWTVGQAHGRWYGYERRENPQRPGEAMLVNVTTGFDKPSQACAALGVYLRVKRL